MTYSVSLYFEYFQILNVHPSLLIHIIVPLHLLRKQINLKFLLGLLYILQYSSINQQLKCKWSPGRMDTCESLVWDTCSQEKSNLKRIYGRWSQRKKENSLFPPRFGDRCEGFGTAVGIAERETSHNRASFHISWKHVQALWEDLRKSWCEKLCVLQPTHSLHSGDELPSAPSSQARKLNWAAHQCSCALCWSTDLKFPSVGRTCWSYVWGLGTSNFIMFSVELHSVKKVFRIQNHSEVDDNIPWPPTHPVVGA